jgi:hypothetical protein
LHIHPAVADVLHKRVGHYASEKNAKSDLELRHVATRLDGQRE